ncbi:hypothetical protein F511_37168 [Dorcoceras hygrometricum]|uniref:Uncharacterized protein n=1 Tax=Dorcoceras hygrometricum TaxID=472368 RepID=A0A2Z7B8I6_9LAMI|nr:hypothetical protein F511_37168 [Dorcoceras hygrometricum]
MKKISAGMMRTSWYIKMVQLNIFEREEFCVQRFEFEQRLIYKGSAIEEYTRLGEKAEVVRVVVAKKRKIKRRQQRKGRTLEDEAVDNHSREELIVVSTAESSSARLGAFP